MQPQRHGKVRTSCGLLLKDSTLKSIVFTRGTIYLFATKTYQRIYEEVQEVQHNLMLSIEVTSSWLSSKLWSLNLNTQSQD